MRTLSVTVAALMAAVITPAAAQTYSWTNDSPANLTGTWVEMGQRCEDENSQLVIFSDGGYRWRQSRTDWGFARGQFSYTGPTPYSVFFRVRRLVQHENPDFQIAVSGNEIRMYSFGSGRERRLEKCRQ
ncbi:hypothetical protein ACM64Y_08630 [Novispirillum sp. DQ9]|uniref:hypothetical protein n=1 Tax=Novispirillum sp. DQ9 TaxID=3398612 RepID=UPI003C7A3578